MNSASGVPQTMASYRIGMDYSVSVANKTKQALKQQGAQALALIESATKISDVSGINSVPRTDLGRLIDISA